MNRYSDGKGGTNYSALLRDAIIAGALLILFAWINPFQTVPTGSRGVVTQFGAIRGIEPEGMVILPPWQNLAIFSIRAEEAQVDEADGSTSDTQPV